MAARRRKKKDPAVQAAKASKKRREVRAAGFSTDADQSSQMMVPPNYTGPPRDYSLRKAGH
jgi:hypothetical protein